VHKYFSVNDYYAVIIVDNSVIVMGPLREKYFRVIRVIRGPVLQATGDRRCASESADRKRQY